MSTRLPERLAAQLRLPMIAAPMFLVSGMEMVAAQCESGVIGAFPSYNARSPEILDQWLGELAQRLQGRDAAPWAVNLNSHRTNPRLAPDLAACVKHRAPVVITALGGPKEVVGPVHSYGGMVLADVNSPAYARKAVEAGADGLVLVCSGAGGHTGTMAAPAFVAAVREFFDGIVVIAGGITNGASLRAAQVMGADLAYMGTRFIATEESLAVPAYKQMVVDCDFQDIICTNIVTGAWANKLKPSLVAAGYDPENLQVKAKYDLSYRDDPKKAWRDIWSAGHGVGQVRGIEPVAQVVDRLAQEYEAALARELDDPWMRRHIARHPSAARAA